MAAVRWSGITRYIIVSIVGGILLAAMDGVINANPLARILYEVYRPIARASVDVVAGVMIDLVYGFVMAGTFLLVYKSLPDQRGLMKGIAFAIIVWFFRVVMYVATQWMTLEIPSSTLTYSLVTGLGEMLVIGTVYGLTLRPLGTD